jgi:hypothetical protein
MPHKKKRMNSQQQMGGSHSEMDERLWDFIDGLSSPSEKAALEGLIAVDRVWRIKYHELLELHQTMASAELEQPSLRFSKNVMEEIARYHVAPATKSYINKNIIRGIGAFFLVTIAGFLVYSLCQFYAADQVVAPDNNSPGMISKYGHAIQNRVDAVNWSGIFNNTYTNIFIMVNMILGLMLLDMYLTRKQRRSGQQEAS